jgi:hypothetical protein
MQFETTDEQRELCLSVRRFVRERMLRATGHRALWEA